LGFYQCSGKKLRNGPPLARHFVSTSDIWWADLVGGVGGRRWWKAWKGFGGEALVGGIGVTNICGGFAGSGRLARRWRITFIHGKAD
jgi:hypothetical protein